MVAALAATVPAAEPSKPSFHATLKAASEVAATDESLVLLIFGAEWCGPCKALKKNTLASSDFLERGGPVRVTEVDIDSDQKTARAFAVSAVPTLVLLSADGKIVARRSGYMDVTNLVAWLDEGRRRLKAGQWEGTAPGSKLDEFAAKAAGQGLQSNDLTRLVAMLAEPDPAERNAVAKLLLAQRERAVPPLIEALSDAYLGVRVAAGELLEKLAPGVVTVDPWQSPSNLQSSVAHLRKWWSETGKLPPPAAARSLDPSLEGAVKSALEALRVNDPVQRTDAMSTLVGHGAAALPLVREAIKRGERAGDPRVVALLEEVRWAILVPDSLERRAGGVRHALARGASPERQAAATRLGKAGREAIEPLSELANDPDPLVVENAVRSLSAIGGQDSVPAMAGLLKAADPNLRMTAAQALGRTKNANSTRRLLLVLDDPNEIVACTALAAVEEVNANDKLASLGAARREEVVAALRGCLKDSRWRVRATTAEIAGKLSVKELIPDLKKLLADSDGFVVKNSLSALHGLSGLPEAAELAALTRRQPSLRADVLRIMAASATPSTVEAVAQMYDDGTADDRLAILAALGHRDKYESRKLDDAWKPLLAKASAANDALTRRAAARLLSLGSANLAAEFLEPLLADDDDETRAAAADVAMGVIAGRRGRAVSSEQDVPWTVFAADDDSASFRPGSTASKTNPPVATPERLAVWQAALLKRPDVSSDPALAAVLYVTGDGKTNLPALVSALEKLDTASAKRLAQSPALAAIVPRLPWPEGQAVLDKLAAWPLLFAVAALESEPAAAPVAAYLLDPARFSAAVEPLSGDELSSVLQLALGSDYTTSGRRAPLFLAQRERTAPLLAALLESTNAAWRAAAVYALGKRAAPHNLPAFEKAMSDPNPWVRAAGVQALGRAGLARAALEERAGPLLAETNRAVALMAALALLEPHIRTAGGLYFWFDYFMFEQTRLSGGGAIAMNEDRLLAPLESRPAYLDAARRHLASAKPEQSPPYLLLLAQHGDFTGLDKFTAVRSEADTEADHARTDAVFTAIALSRDSKYVPALRGFMDEMRTQWELQKILKAARGMTGAEVRQLRLDVNRRIRGGAEE